MKLSEAILLGSTLSGQAVRVFEALDGSRCALGSALAAAGFTFECHLDATEKLKTLWPHLTFEWYGNDLRRGYRCPEPGCGAIGIDLAGIIVHLNDNEFWSREKIAAWVAQFDPIERIVQGETAPEALTQAAQLPALPTLP